MNIDLTSLFWAFALLFGGFFALIGLVIALVGALTLRDRLRCARWPQVTGTIASSGIRETASGEGAVRYRPEVRYRFAVGESLCEGRRLAFVEKLYAKREGAEKVVGQYPPGMAVRVRYDPDRPREAVLHARGGVAAALLTVFGLLMVAGPLWGAAEAGLPVGVIGAGLGLLVGLAVLIGFASSRPLRRLRRAGIYPKPGCGTPEDVERLIRQGRKILAVRLYRELHGGGLKEARLQVEELAARISAEAH